jgi:hypothetical protein
MQPRSSQELKACNPQRIKIIYIIDTGVFCLRSLDSGASSVLGIGADSQFKNILILGHDFSVER